jgi:NTE family protein
MFYIWILILNQNQNFKHEKSWRCLKGGGARSFAHLALLKVLDEEGIKPFAISGVSGGALVGVLYAAGISP